MNSLEIQNSIKINSDELQDYLRDLKSWEKDIKLEDLKLSKKKTHQSINSLEIPPIRKKNSNIATTKMKELPSIVEKEKNFKKKAKNTRISSYDYAAWDKFVDKALESGSEEESVSEDNIQTKIEEIKEDKNEKTIHGIQKRNEENTLLKIERAERLKEEGNVCYSKGNLSDAIAKYTQGIGLDPANAFLPANRAMAYLKLKKFKAAENDCTKALQLDSNYIKAYLRRAVARANIPNLSGAVEDYEKVLKLEPWNREAKRELEKLKKGKCQSISTESQKLSKSVVDNAQLKKMKTDQIPNENYNQCSKTNEIHPINIPIQLQSTKPLVRVPVVEINSREEMEAILSKKRTKVQPQNVSLIKPSNKLLSEKKESLKPDLPLVPKTSHQFAQDWQKIRKYEDLSLSYLKKVPTSFFKGIEIEVDLLVEIVEVLCSNNVESEIAAVIMSSLMKSRGFFLNVAFLESCQRKVFENLIKKIETCEVNENIEDLNLLKSSL